MPEFRYPDGSWPRPIKEVAASICCIDGSTAANQAEYIYHASGHYYGGLTKNVGHPLRCQMVPCSWLATSEREVANHVRGHEEFNILNGDESINRLYSLLRAAQPPPHPPAGWRLSAPSSESGPYLQNEPKPSPSPLSPPPLLPPAPLGSRLNSRLGSQLGGRVGLRLGLTVGSRVGLSTKLRTDRKVDSRPNASIRLTPRPSSRRSPPASPSAELSISSKRWLTIRRKRKLLRWLKTPTPSPIPPPTPPQPPTLLPPLPSTVQISLLVPPLLLPLPPPKNFPGQPSSPARGTPPRQSSTPERPNNLTSEPGPSPRPDPRSNQRSLSPEIEHPVNRLAFTPHSGCFALVQPQRRQLPPKKRFRATIPVGQSTIQNATAIPGTVATEKTGAITLGLGIPQNCEVDASVVAASDSGAGKCAPWWHTGIFAKE